ncbi:hypothetical protein GWK47_046411 [Chionoecetes opilio]|uniref:Uncharacterized protein n=1 Tax=Chionoecetes opilio TaxID=41210 RepID=A0A8J4Y7C3_CHIOP|nr:hypothetical protein GWK47_046411 [Chionoecetes opilio]
MEEKSLKTSCIYSTLPAHLPPLPWGTTVPTRHPIPQHPLSLLRPTPVIYKKMRRNSTTLFTTLTLNLDTPPEVTRRDPYRQPLRGIRYQPSAEAAGEEEPAGRPTSGSLASLTSSGYDSLKKKFTHELGGLEPLTECAGTLHIASSRLRQHNTRCNGYTTSRSQEVFGEGEEGEGGLAGEVPGHSRNSSNTSHGSHASGYASINSQSESGHMR